MAKYPPETVFNFFENTQVKNNLLVLTGEKSQFASVDKAARHLYAALKANGEIPANHVQRSELDEKMEQYQKDFQTTILTVFDKLLFPGTQSGKPMLRAKPLDTTYPANEPYNGERQVIKTLTSDPIKLYIDVSVNFDALKTRAESLLFGNQNDVRRSDMLDKMKQQTQMPWMVPNGIILLIQECCQRGLWEDLGNGYITKAPKPKATGVQITPRTEPDDKGYVKLQIDTLNAGPVPRVHFEEDGPVSENSKVLNENELVTNALRVQFLVVDPSGKNSTGAPISWQNKLVIRNHFNDSNRTVELFVAPRGNIRFTLDGTEPREGTEYTGRIVLENKNEVRMLCFAECEGIEARRDFTFAAEGAKGVFIVKEKPAVLYSPTPKRLDSSAKTFDGLKSAREKGIEFEKVVLKLGSDSRVISLTMGEIRVTADAIEKLLSQLRVFLPADAPLAMHFSRAHFTTGFDLEQFAKSIGIELEQDEVQQ